MDDGYHTEKPMKKDGYISPEELELTHQLMYNIDRAEKQREMALFAKEKAHADLRAAEAELRAAQAEYNGTLMKLLWKYKLENDDTIRQSDGHIIKGEKKNEEKGNDSGDESKES